MNEEQYREIFRELGIEAREIGHTLRWKGLSGSCYFNRNRKVGIYFTTQMRHEARYPFRLWERINPNRVKATDRNLLNVVPRPGVELAAFRQLTRHWEQEL